jgi:hypothetical protein
LLRSARTKPERTRFVRGLRVVARCFGSVRAGLAAAAKSAPSTTC